MVTSTCALSVLLADRIIGTVSPTNAGYCFAYHNGPYPLSLSLSMPQTKTTHSPPLIEHWLSGLLPDKLQARTDWAAARNVEADPVSLLSTDIGFDCAGAVRFCLEGNEELLFSQDGCLQNLPEAEVGKMIAGLAASYGSAASRSLLAPVSLAGWQPKTALRLSKTGWAMPTGTEPSSHILKPQPENDWADLPVNEWFSLATAANVGLLTAEASLGWFNDVPTLIITRFDRYWEGERLLRAHIEDLCQATGRPPGEKYEMHGGPSIKEICGLIRSQTSVDPRNREADVRRFVDYMIFNWLIANNDNHAKNHSLVHTTAGARLAPLYDTCSLLSLREDYLDCYMSFRVGGEKAIGKISSEQWRGLAEDCGLAPEAVTRRVVSLSEKLPEAVDKTMNDLKSIDTINAMQGDLINKGSKFADAFVQRARWCATNLN